MTTKEIIAEIKSNLTDNLQDNIIYLDKVTAQYKTHEDSVEILKAVSNLVFDMLPQEKKDLMKETLFVNGVRLDEIHHRAVTLVRANNVAAAGEMIRPATEHILKYFKGNNEVFFSFKNPFEEQLAGQLFKTNKKIVHAPVDFSEIFLLYGYILIDMHKYDEAIPQLENAIAYNPVNINAYFELCESYKAGKNPEMLLFTTKDALKIAYTRPIIARCYTNLGYYCVETEDYDSAVCFYMQSVIFDDNPQIAKELEFIVRKTNNEIVPPTNDDVQNAFKKYGLEMGPNGIVINVANTLGRKFLEAEDKVLAKFCIGIAADLTNDKELKELFESIKPDGTAAEKTE